jgi:hypothetical protein
MAKKKRSIQVEKKEKFQLARGAYLTIADRCSLDFDKKLIARQRLHTN